MQFFVFTQIKVFVCCVSLDSFSRLPGGKFANFLNASFCF